VSRREAVGCCLRNETPADGAPRFSSRSPAASRSSAHRFAAGAVPPHSGMMTERRLRVGVVYGGRSGEHEISLRSAASIIAALDAARYEVVPIAITKDGRWLTGRDSLAVLEAAQRDLAPIPEHGREVTLPADPTRHGLLALGRGEATPLDVVFPVLHGTYGEDGTI